MYCSNCGVQNVETARFCEKCGTGLVAMPPAQPPKDTGVRGVASTPAGHGLVAIDKNPIVAVVLSLIPGLGQFYNNDYKKGALMLFVALVGAVPTGGILWLVFLVWSMFDAYQVASGKGKRW